MFARHSLSEISRPHDPFPLSVLASSLLIALFLAARVGCLFPTREYSDTNHIARWLWTILVAGLFIGASLLIIASETQRLSYHGISSGERRSPGSQAVISMVPVSRWVDHAAPTG